MPEKLCPFDRNPCIREHCAVFAEDRDCCGLISIPPQKKERTLSLRKDLDEPKDRSLHYRAHLFD